jgi:23S rRNA pseudouridine1911/1915/1917 synthase
MSSASTNSEPIELLVPESQAGMRLDAFLALHLASYSRVFLRRVINTGAVRVGTRGGKASYRVRAGERVVVTMLPPVPRGGPVPEEIPLEVLYEDEHLAAINKPPGMVVHPARGHWTGTLASALQHHFNQLSSAGGPTRPGIVHRLDRDTSGVILVAKHDQAHHRLALQFQERTLRKEYFAIVAGRPDRDRDHIDLPIGLHPHQREKMAVRTGDKSSRNAHSFYEVLERFDGFATLRILPKTGRTHQIRVHLASIHCPVLCDRQYGGRAQITRAEIRRSGDDQTVLLARHALHAARLEITHPMTGQPLALKAPMPDDLAQVLMELRMYRSEHR